MGSLHLIKIDLHTLRSAGGESHEQIAVQVGRPTGSQAPKLLQMKLTDWGPYLCFFFCFFVLWRGWGPKNNATTTAYNDRDADGDGAVDVDAGWAGAVAIYGLDLCISATGSLMRTQILNTNTCTHTVANRHIEFICNLFHFLGFSAKTFGHVHRTLSGSQVGFSALLDCHPASIELLMMAI